MKDKKRKPTAYLICGFIGAGKTTFAKKLEKETSAIRFTKDEWIIKIFGNNPRQIQNFKKYDDRICDLSTEIAFQCLDKGLDTIIDDGFWFKSQRKQIIKELENMGVEVKMYFVSCPIDVMKKRTIGRNDLDSKSAFKIDEKMFNKYLLYWEQPQEDEDFILIN